MNSQRFDQLCKPRIFFDTGEDIESLVDVVELVVAEVEVEGVEDVTLGDLAVEGGDGEPGAEVVAGDVAGDSVPDFEGGALVGGFGHEVDLGGFGLHVY